MPSFQHLIFWYHCLILTLSIFSSHFWFIFVLFHFTFLCLSQPIAPICYCVNLLVLLCYVLWISVFCHTFLHKSREFLLTQMWSNFFTQTFNFVSSLNLTIYNICYIYEATFTQHFFIFKKGFESQSSGDRWQLRVLIKP